MATQQYDLESLRALIRSGKPVASRRNQALDAEIVRELVLEIALGDLPNPRGLTFEGMVINGFLDLSGAMAPGDAPLGPLKFLACRFTAGLRLDRARIRRLSLQNSRFHRFQARDVEFMSTLDLRGVRSPGRASDGSSGRRLQNNECSIDLANAMIDGDLWLQDAKLKVGAPCGEEARTGPLIYALVLRGAEIRGAARLEPGFFADGGVTVADAHVHGDLRMHGAHLTATYGAALRGQNTRVDGIVFCRGVEEGEPFVATGNLDGGVIFQNATLARLDLRHSRISGGRPGAVTGWVAHGDHDRAGIALDLSSGIIAAGIVAGGAIGPGRAEFTGWVTLRAASIKGDVVFSGAHIDAVPPERAIQEKPGEETTTHHDDRSAPFSLRYAFDLRGADIRGSLRADRGFISRGGITLADIVMGGDVFLQGSRLIAFRAPLGLAGSPAKRRKDDDFLQSVDDASIGPGQTDQRMALRGRNASIGGVLRGAGEGKKVSRTFRPLICWGGVSFPNAEMDKVDLGGARIGGASACLDFSSARIRGSFLIRAVEIADLADDGAPETGARVGPVAAKAPVRRRIWTPMLFGPLTLVDAEVSGDVNIDTLLSKQTRSPSEEGEADAGESPAKGGNEGARSADVPQSYSGAARADGNRVEAAGAATALRKPRATDGPLLDASGAKVSGSLVIGKSLFDGAGTGSRLIVRMLQRHASLTLHQARTRQRLAGAPASGEEEADDKRCSHIRLVGARLGRDLIVHLGSAATNIVAPAIVVDGDFVLQGVGSASGVLAGADLEISGGRIGQSLSTRDIDISRIDGPSLNVGRDINIFDCRVSGPVGFVGARIAASVHVERVEFRVEGGKPDSLEDLLSLGGAVIANQLKVRRLVAPPDPTAPESEPTLNLSFVQLGQLNDLAGTSWPSRATMNLKGLTYRSILFDDNDKENDDPVRWVKADAALQTKYASKRRSIRYGLWITAFLTCAGALVMHWRRVDGDFAFAFLTFMTPFIVYYGRRLGFWNRIKRVHHRLSWMDQQYTSNNKVSVKHYFPQPFTQLARTYRSHGLHEFADAVLARRARLDARTRTDRLSEAAERRRQNDNGVSVRVLKGFRFVTISIPTWIYDVTFGFGLNAWATVLTFFCYGLFGVFLFMAEADQAPPGQQSDGICGEFGYAAIGTLYRLVPVLDKDVDKVCKVAAPEPMKVTRVVSGEAPAVTQSPVVVSAQPRPLAPSPIGAAGHAPATPRTTVLADHPATASASARFGLSGQPSRSLWWAISELGQALWRLWLMIDISGQALWRLWWTIYSFGGWVVTSLTILTLTGVLRRVAES